MSYLVVISIAAIALSLPCKSSVLNKRQIVDDPLLEKFQKQEILLQKIEKQANDKASELDKKITVQAKKWEHALASHDEDIKKLIRKMYCPPRGFFYNDFGCYKFVYDKLSHDNATAHCRQYQSHLVELQSVEKSEALISLMNERGAQHGYYHLGARKVNNVWTWTDSRERFTFTNWFGHQAKDCAQFYYNPFNWMHKKWEDDDCMSYKTYFVCEI